MLTGTILLRCIVYTVLFFSETPCILMSAYKINIIYTIFIFIAFCLGNIILVGKDIISPNVSQCQRIGL